MTPLSASSGTLISATGLVSGADDESPIAAYPSIHFCMTSGVLIIGGGGETITSGVGGLTGLGGGLIVGVLGGGGSVLLGGGVTTGVGLGTGVVVLGNFGS